MIRLLTAALLLASLSTGCVTRNQSVTNVTSVDDLDVGKLSALKKGESCESYLFFISWGNTLVTAAARNGKIHKVKFVENEDRSYVVYSEDCTIVYGT